MNMLSKILNTLFWVITIPLVAYLFFIPTGLLSDLNPRETLIAVVTFAAVGLTMTSFF
jgi:hypothetical protein